MPSEKNPYFIIGGGIVGLAVGWQLARRNQPVEIFERNRAGRAASWVAAGMLAPQTEVGFEEIDLLQLGQESLRLYPDFLMELEEDSGMRIPLDRCGTLMIGLDRDDAERLRRLYNFRKQLQLPVEWLSGTEARELEPFLSPKTIAAIWIPNDAQVDNRALVEALIIAFQKRGGVLHEHRPVTAVRIENNEVLEIQTANGEPDAHHCGVVLSAGCWSKTIEGIPEAIAPPVRPVKGQILTLRMNEACKLSRIVHAPDAYLVPKGDGRLIVGASSEEMGFDLSPTAGPIMKLLERAWEAVPSVYELPIEEIQVGLRPGSRDHAPIIGETEVRGLYYATGHYRHGILLAPITAYGLSDLILKGTCSELLAKFHPSRFQQKGKILQNEDEQHENHTQR